MSTLKQDLKAFKQAIMNRDSNITYQRFQRAARCADAANRLERKIQQRISILEITQADYRGGYIVYDDQKWWAAHLLEKAEEHARKLEDELESLREWKRLLDVAPTDEARQQAIERMQHADAIKVFIEPWKDKVAELEAALAERDDIIEDQLCASCHKSAHERVAELTQQVKKLETENLVLKANMAALNPRTPSEEFERRVRKLMGKEAKSSLLADEKCPECGETAYAEPMRDGGLSYTCRKCEYTWDIPCF